MRNLAIRWENLLAVWRNKSFPGKTFTRSCPKPYGMKGTASPVLFDNLEIDELLAMVPFSPVSISPFMQAWKLAYGEMSAVHLIMLLVWTEPVRSEPLLGLALSEELPIQPITLSTALASA